MRHSLILIIFIIPLSNVVNAQFSEESFSFSLNQSLPRNTSMPRLSPFGFEISYGTSNPNVPMGLRFSLGHQNYGMKDHGDFVTSHNIYSFDFGLTFDLVDTKRFGATIIGSCGLNRFVTRSYMGTNEWGQALLFAIWLLTDDEEDDNDLETEPLVVLEKFASFSPSFSAALNLEWRFDESNGLFFEAGYRYIPSIELIEKDHVIVSVDDIQYIPTSSQLEMLNFKVGYVYRF